jgi:tripartite-type tricarboxylate transporter receptor subunit TctC
MQLCRRIFGANRTPEEVIDLLQAILNRTISDEEWDSFVSVKIADPNLERVRMRIEELWV